VTAAETASLVSSARRAGAARPLRLSIVVEWENTVLNGIPRAWALLDALGDQWRAILERRHPVTLPPQAAVFLAELAPRPELIAVSGRPLDEAARAEILRRASPVFDVSVQVAEGLEYYPLKNHGARLATGDLLLFVDSDVLPDAGWLAHLLGSFSRPEILVVSGQTYVGPHDLVSRAFALGWTYELRDDTDQMAPCRKFYGNNVAFRREVFPEGGFPPLGPRTRGASSQVRAGLRARGIEIWQNRRAAVDHPPPADFRHLVVRALAHGRDHYMKQSSERHLGGLQRSVGKATTRCARGFSNTFRERRRVGLPWWQVPGSLAVIATYYGFFALGGLLTHVSPQAMGRRFRL
jgi:hypothetical protein